MEGKRDSEVYEIKVKSVSKHTERKTEHEILLQRKQIDVKKKARDHWTLLKASVRSVIKAVEEADLRELEITHGIYIERKLNHQQEVCQVLYIHEHKEYVTSDGQNFYIFFEDGQKKSEVQSMEKINRIVYSSQTNQFVGWVYGQENLYLMSQDFMVKSQAKAVGRILMSAYNHNNGELITAGPHFITCWAFRHGARYLIPRKTFTTNLVETSMFKTMVLEDTASQAQRIFFAQANGVVIYNVFSGVEFAHKKELHTQPVTALTFFNPFKYVITGARDGCIKVWDQDWKIKMVFVGHSDQVNFLQIYSQGPSFISASLDCTIRVWNMNTCDEMDKTVISEPIEGMGTQRNHDTFFTFAGKRVDLWKLQHLYHIHTHIGYRVHNIKVTNHPMFPQRAIVMCRDSSVRIICPSNGEVITTLMMKQAEGLIDAAYAIAEDTIFTVVSNGEIVKSMTHQNPCEIVSRWKCTNPQEICNCLLVYEYVVDLCGSSDVWTLTKQRAQTSEGRSVWRQQNSKNRTLLLGGQKDGYVCVFDWYTGDVTFKAEAHGSKGVLSMTANPRSNQLISAGADNVIKVWRLYPFAQEALTPLMSFYCAHCPSIMTAIKMRLGVAFQDPSTATFSVVVYNLSEKDRVDHKPDDDHMDLITGFTSCPRMKLYASSSIDGTICIWSENNTLLRLLHLNTGIHSIAFCSPKGDLMVGIDTHLFLIPHSKFLPKSYKRKQVCMKFLPVKSEQPLPYDENKLNLMEKSDLQRLKSSYSSFKCASVTDIIPLNEQKERVKEKQNKEEAFKLLELRENEIKQIRDGTLRSQNKPKSTKITKNTAFREYMKMYYNKEREKIPLDDEYAKDTLQKKLAGESPSEEGDKYHPEDAAYGFFSELGQKCLEENPTSHLHQCYPSVPSGFLPNSILIKILHPPPVSKEVPWELIPYQPPELTLKQLAEIHSIYKKEGTGQDIEDLELELDRTMIYDYDDHMSLVLETDLTEDDSKYVQRKHKMHQNSDPSDKSLKRKKDSAAGKTAGKSKKEKINKSNVNNEDVEDDEDDNVIVSHSGLSEKASLMSKLQGIINKPSSVTTDSEDVPKSSPPPKKIKHQSAVLVKPIVKLISHPEIKLPAIPSPRSPTPALSTTPLPSFIKKFVAMEWFLKYFPNCNEHTMPKPWTSDTFVLMICKLLRIAEWTDRVNVTDAILCVYIEEGLNESVTLNVARSLVAVLNHHASPPACSVVEEKAFILSALKALAALVIKEKDVVAEMMVQFVVGDRDVRSAVLDVMTHLGLVDPHRQFQKELDSWDIWNIEEENLRSELHNMCNQWLEKWMTSYKMRIKDSMNLLNQGHTLQGHISNMSSVSGGLNKTGVKATERETVVSSHGMSRTDNLTVTDSTRNGHVSSVSDGSLTVTIDRLHSLSILESVNYLDAMTYFCEITTDKELEALKRGELLRAKQGDRVIQAKNTVLVLPRISQKPALVRLGEMHTSQCRPERESTLHTDFRMPPITVRGRHPVAGDLNRFVSCINLPMKTVYLNPFLAASDHTDSQPVLITLKLSKKYFIPSMSYVPVGDHVALGS